MLEFAPGKPFSLDNYRSLQVDSVCEEGFPEVFGITPTSLEEIAPGYLKKGMEQD
jgi:NADH dehydrogenase